MTVVHYGMYAIHHEECGSPITNMPRNVIVAMCQILCFQDACVYVKVSNATKHLDCGGVLETTKLLGGWNLNMGLCWKVGQ